MARNYVQEENEAKAPEKNFDHQNVLETPFRGSVYFLWHFRGRYIFSGISGVGGFSLAFRGSVYFLWHFGGQYIFSGISGVSIFSLAFRGSVYFLWHLLVHHFEMLVKCVIIKI